MSLSRTDIKYFKTAVGLDRIGKETDVDISARCPICGDSRRNKNMKRLHLYNKGNVTNVSCFNGDCPVNNKTVYSFLRDFYPALLSQYKKETFSNTLEKLANGESDVFGFLNEKEETKTKILTQDFSQFFKLIEDVPEALSYLEGRLIKYNKEKYGQWYFGYQDLKIGDTLYKITNAIIIPLYYKGEMYAFYSRNIYDKTFYTYMNDSNIGYKIWQWFDIDKDKDVYIFESIFDAISSGLENVIALMGAQLPEERLKELKKPVFVLDQDKTGIVNSIKYSKMGHLVFAQPEGYKKDMNENLKEQVDCKELILNNLFTGISAEIRLKAKL